MTNALIYVRISQDREGGGLGVERQLEDCQALAAQLGWTVVGVYDDNDVSAYSGKVRKGYRAMLADLREGKATRVIAWHTDRLHRSPVELEEYIDVCEAGGIITQTVKAGPLDLATPSGRLVARMLGANARYESEQKAERIKRAALQRAQAGKYSGGVRPFGYAKDGMTLIPEEADMIRCATDQILAGATLRSVTKDWNATARLTPRGCPWETVEVKAVLIRARNAGLSVYQGEVVGAALWPAIVTEDAWKAVTAILTDPARRTTPGSKVKWLGSCIYLCECGSTMVCTKVNRGGGDGYTYVCRANRDRKVPGTHTARVAQGMDLFVSSVVVERLSRPDAVDLLASDADAIDTVALNSESVTLRQRLTDLADLFANGTVDAAQLASGSARMRTRLAEIDAELAKAAAINPLAAIVGADDVRAAWDGLSLDRQRAIIRTLMTVTIHPTKRGCPKGFTKAQWGQPGAYFDASTIEIRWLNEVDPTAD